jgi:spore coat protein U-like protein
MTTTTARLLGVILSRAIVWVLLTAAVLVIPSATRAQAGVSCTVTPPTLAFGAYNPTSTSDVRTQGTVTISCSHGNPQVRISIGPGRSGTVAQRELQRAGGGTTPLRYNLYTDASLTTIWGEGSAGVSTRAKSPPPVVYGRVPAQQIGLEAGSYSDTLVVTVEY